MPGVDYVLFEAGSSVKPDSRSGEAIFWARNLLPPTVKLEVCFGNKAIIKKIKSLATVCTAADRVFVVFDNANLYRYTKDGNLALRKSGQNLWNNVLDAVSQCKARCFRCLSLSFEALILETGLLSDIITMLMEYYTQKGDHKRVTNLGVFKKYMQDIPSLKLDLSPAATCYLQRLFNFVPEDLLREGSEKEPGPEITLFQLLNHSLQHTEFKVQKDRIGPCWRDACSNIPSCVAKKTCAYSELCECVKLNSDDGINTLAWKEKVIKEGLGISDFTDLFEEILK